MNIKVETKIVSMIKKYHNHKLQTNPCQDEEESHNNNETKDVYKYSFYPHTISDWNRLPTTVTDVQTLQEFREGLSSLPLQLL